MLAKTQSHWNPHTLLVGAYHRLEKLFDSYDKLNIHLQCDLAIFLLCGFPRAKNICHKTMCVCLFIILQNWKWPQRSSTGEWINRVSYNGAIGVTCHPIWGQTPVTADLSAGPPGKDRLRVNPDRDTAVREHGEVGDGHLETRTEDLCFPVRLGPPPCHRAHWSTSGTGAASWKKKRGEKKPRAASENLELDEC